MNLTNLTKKTRGVATAGMLGLGIATAGCAHTLEQTIENTIRQLTEGEKKILVAQIIPILTNDPKILVGASIVEYLGQMERERELLDRGTTINLNVNTQQPVNTPQLVNTQTRTDSPQREYTPAQRPVRAPVYTPIVRSPQAYVSARYREDFNNRILEASKLSESVKQFTDDEDILLFFYLDGGQESQRNIKIRAPNGNVIYEENIDKGRLTIIGEKDIINEGDTTNMMQWLTNGGIRYGNFTIEGTFTQNGERYFDTEYFRIKRRER